MQRPDVREVLSAVRHGKQWRIPRPEQLYLWEYGIPIRLRALGIEVPGRLRAALEKRAKKCEPYWRQVYRLALAAYTKALAIGRLTPKAKEGIDLLCLGAAVVLKAKDQRAGIDGLKDAVIRHLKQEWHVRVPFRLARYWPGERQFQAIRSATTRKQVEALRRKLDFTQALKYVARLRDARGKQLQPTAQNLCPLLHVDWLAHLNDTREKLPQVPLWDFRSPQPGISLDQFRRRYPLRRQPWCSLIASAYNGNANPPDTKERVSNGKTPVRNSNYGRARFGASDRS